MVINIREAAKLLGITRATLYAWQEQGKMPKPITSGAVWEYLDNRAHEITEGKSRLLDLLKEDLAEATP